MSSSHPQSEGLRIESVEHDRFLSFNGHKLSTESGDDNKIFVWFIEAAHGNNFFVSALSHDVRLSSSRDGHLFTSKNRDPWEKWCIESTNDEVGQYTIRSVEHGKYLGTLDNDTRIISSEVKHLWTISLSAHEGGRGCLIQSTECGRELTCGDDGNLCTTDDGNFTWQLEPILPRTISSGHIWSYGGLGVAMPVALGVAAQPFALKSIKSIAALGMMAVPSSEREGLSERCGGHVSWLLEPVLPHGEIHETIVTADKKMIRTSH